jgi:hypothetical protein
MAYLQAGLATKLAYLQDAVGSNPTHFASTPAIGI